MFNFAKTKAVMAQAKPCPADLTHGSPGCVITLECKEGVKLEALRCALSNASPILREALSLKLAKPGVLELPEDNAADWELMIRMIQPGTYPPAAVNWENVERLLHLADKYDMAVVRGYCANFLSRNTSSLTLSEPLLSPTNPLMAATLVCKYCNLPELKPYTDAVQHTLCAVLAPMSSSAGATVKSLVALLKPLTAHERFHDAIAPAV
ncbi:hypothetical protein Agub_g2327, partial [Astrephomene gubernaculifera]